MSAHRRSAVPLIAMAIGIAVGMSLMRWIDDRPILPVMESTLVPVAAAGDAPASMKSNEGNTKNAGGKAVSSQKLQIDLQGHQLHYRNGSLQLSTWKTGTDDMTTSALDFKVPAGGSIVELHLTKWLGKNLAAVAKIVRGDEREYYCIFIRWMRPFSQDGKQQDGFRWLTHAHKMLTTREDYQILATNGGWGGDNFLAVLGKIEFADGESGEWWPAYISSGAFYTDFCPFPPEGYTQEFKLAGPKSKVAR